MEIIKEKHMLYLLNILLDRTREKTMGFNRESLCRVRDILKERYDIKN